MRCHPSRLAGTFKLSPSARVAAPRGVDPVHPSWPVMHRLPPPGRRRAYTLLELLVVLVLLGLSAAVVLPRLRLPSGATAHRTTIERARAVAVRRGEPVRLSWTDGGDWTVRATADTSGVTLLSGTDGALSATVGARSLVISALGACLPEGTATTAAPAWDPARCRSTRN